MKTSVLVGIMPEPADVEVLALPVFDDGSLPEITARLATQGDLDFRSIADRYGLNSPGKMCWIPWGRSDGPRDLLLVCIGPSNGGSAREQDLRKAAIRAGRAVDRTTLAIGLAHVPVMDGSAAAIVTEGAVIGAYDYVGYHSVKGDRRPRRPQITQILVPDDAAAAEARRALIRAESTNFVRDLVNMPANALGPSEMADIAVQEARKYGLQVARMEADQLKAGGFGGLFGVGASSSRPPVLVDIRYPGTSKSAPVALVGKGLTFDTGGLDIKSASSMRTMKVDMAGAAVVLAAALAAGRLGLSTPVRAILACAENMLGPAALHPGDIVTQRNGLTCEIVDTDSEGRLVLADAISYAVEEHPRQVVSVATLTGAASLGNEVWAVLGSNSELNRDILAAAAEVGEAGWEMPIVDAYRSYIVSPVADLKNFYDDGVKWTFGAILAALYLREFAGGVDWVHLDICATAVREENEWWAHGATGSGTSTVIRHLQRIDERAGQI